MEKKIVSLRMRIKDINGVTLTEMNTYGVMQDERTIYSEGRYFKAGRKSGFGKTNKIYESPNGEFHEVIIDRIEEMDKDEMMNIERKCGNCKYCMFVGWDGILEGCMDYEMATTEEDEIIAAADCGKYEFGTPKCLERDDEYTPSATNGDYGPSCPWNAPGMSVRDFI